MMPPHRATRPLTTPRTTWGQVGQQPGWEAESCRRQSEIIFSCVQQGKVFFMMMYKVVFHDDV
jgi:hypothetical protein